MSVRLRIFFVLVIVAGLLTQFNNCADPLPDMSQFDQASVSGSGSVSALTIAVNPQTVTVNQSAQITVSGGTAPYNYVVTSGSASVTGDGVVTGTAAGAVTVEITDGDGQVGYVSVTVVSSGGSVGGSCTTAWGQVVPHGGQIVGFASATVACDKTCVSETQTCMNGVLSGTFTATSGTCSVSTCISCPNNYIRVPALSGYTAADFCVAKYEAKQLLSSPTSPGVSTAAGVPRGNLSRATAINICTLNGAKYDLITNDEWQTVARNIENVASNWSGGTVGSGTLNLGHTDNSPANGLAASTDDNDPCSGTGQTCSSSVWHSQRRTHSLSTGGVIWDLGGNYVEWTKDSNSTNFGADTFISQLTSGGVMGVIGTVNRNGKGHFGPEGNWSALGAPAYGGMGQALTNYSAGGVVRGGAYLDSNAGVGGIFKVGLDNAVTKTWIGFGARCVYHP